MKLRYTFFAALFAMAGLIALPAPAARASAYQAGAQAQTCQNAFREVEDYLDTLPRDASRSAALASVDRRLFALRDSSALAMFKLDAIASSAAAANVSPFHLVAPTPQEFFARVLDQFRAGRLVLDGLGTDAPLLEQRLAQATHAAGQAVVDAYLRAAAADVSPGLRQGARHYLSAYLLASLDPDTAPAALRLVSDAVTAGRPPVFLAEDALSAMGDPEIALVSLEMLRSIAWSDWDSARWRDLMKSAAILAESMGRQDVAVGAYATLADADAGDEGAQRSLIRGYAEVVKDYPKAAQAADDFLLRFPSSAEAGNVHYLKVLYLYHARNFEDLLAEAARFSEYRAGSPLLPQVTLLEGLALTAHNRPLEAIPLYDAILQEHPRLAPQAQFLIAHAHLVARQYPEARDAFQRVVDFYPADPVASDAQKHLTMLENLR